MKPVFVLAMSFLVSLAAAGQSWGDSSITSKPVFYAVETPPKFPGGAQGFYKFLSENLVMPARTTGVLSRKTVIVDAYIDPFGKIVFAQVSKGTDALYSNAALELVSKMPIWIPAKQNGRAVPVVISLPIIFLD